MLARVAMPAVRQKRSKLAPTSCQASSAMATGTTAADVVEFFMALLLLRGFSTPSLLAQGEQRLPSYFNIDRDIPASLSRVIGQFGGVEWGEEFGSLWGMPLERFRGASGRRSTFL